MNNHLITRKTKRHPTLNRIHPTLDRISLDTRPKGYISSIRQLTEIHPTFDRRLIQSIRHKTEYHPTLDRCHFQFIRQYTETHPTLDPRLIFNHSNFYSNGNLPSLACCLFLDIRYNAVVFPWQFLDQTTKNLIPLDF